LWRISDVPPSLFADELDVGYQAYSILKTGRDYYGNFMPIHFHSLAEWRTPLYLYSAVPTVMLFGISPLGVRLPAAIFGILSVFIFYLLVKQITNHQSLATIASAVLTFSPWHIQYSRAGFEVTLLLFLLLLGLWLFFKSLQNGKWLWLSAVCLALTPWVYSTAKLFTPLLLVFLFLLWRKKILKLSKKYLIFTALSLILVGMPVVYSTLFGGGAQRFGYVSIFTDPTSGSEVGTAREIDARMRGEEGVGLSPKLLDRVIHNKYTFWGKNILNNYFRSFSTDFLFVKGDINPRHSIGTGEFYKIESIALILGLIFFLTGRRDIRIKFLIVFWILAGAVPAAITRDGGNHATRLILILPPLILLIAYGVKELLAISKLGIFIYLLIWLLGIGSYLHNYYVHYPWESERWWHYGYEESIKTIKLIEKDYDKVVITTASEPPWIFFAGWYEYPPDKWQREFPIGNDKKLAGFGKISHIDKYYFGSIGSDKGIEGLGSIIDNKTLYLAAANEIKDNLILKPNAIPENIKMIKAIAYPSGEPAFYLFTGKK
jgi:hypothetical protein